MEFASISILKSLIHSVNFHINAKLGFGESIRISGNIKELGMNIPNKSLELFTTPEKLLNLLIF